VNVLSCHFGLLANRKKAYKLLCGGMERTKSYDLISLKKLSLFKKTQVSKDKRMRGKGQRCNRAAFSRRGGERSCKELPIGGA